MIEIRIALQPKQRLLKETIEKVPVAFFGGAKGGGKSKGVQLVNLLRRVTIAKSHSAIFRRTYGELEGNHIRPLFESYPHLRAFYNESKKLLSLPNGSTTEFCYCKNEQDVFVYQGREFHDLFIDEVGQWTEAMFRTLHGSNRSSAPNIKPRAILTGNPGGRGHRWLKRLFIDRKFSEKEDPKDYAFIPALVSDNKALMENDPGYLKKLEAEPNESLRRAYLYGDWDILAGQFFDVVREQVLVRPFDIPKHWVRFGGYDYGFNHAAAFVWCAIDEDGVVYVYRELGLQKTRVDEYAKRLNQYPDTQELYPIAAGRDCWTQRNTVTKESPPSIAEEFATHNIHLKPANIDRIPGAAQIRSYLGHGRLKIFDTCMSTYDTLVSMQHDPNNIEDVVKFDASQDDAESGDDFYDALRYALMSRPAISDQPKLKLKYGTKEYEEKQVERMKLIEDEMEQNEMQKAKREKMQDWWER